MSKPTHLFHAHVTADDGVVDVLEITAINKNAARSIVERERPGSRILGIYANGELSSGRSSTPAVKAADTAPTKPVFRNPITEAFLQGAGRKPAPVDNH